MMTTSRVHFGDHFAGKWDVNGWILTTSEGRDDRPATRFEIGGLKWTYFSNNGVDHDSMRLWSSASSLSTPEHVGIRVVNLLFAIFGWSSTPLFEK